MRRNTVVAVAAVGALIAVAILASPKASDSRRWERESQLTDPGDDPRYKTAEAEARRRWPEFVAAFARRAPGDTFSVKSAFSDGKQTEWMWIRVESIEPDGEGGQRIKGTLASEPVYARNVARAAGISESSMKVLFHKALGMSWVKYLQGYRIHRAAANLCLAGSSITEAAFNVGFDSISHFNSTFRSFMGVSPSEYQKSSRLKPHRPHRGDMVAAQGKGESSSRRPE